MKREVKSFVLTPLVPFVLICYGPLLFFLAAFVPGVFLTAFLGPEGKLFILLGILAIVYPAFIIRVSYPHCLKSASWLNVGLKLYMYWLLLLAPLVFLLLNALGGVSMAVVDGVAGTYEDRLPMYMAHTAVMILVAHVILVPWLFVSVFFVRRSTRMRRREKETTP